MTKEGRINQVKREAAERINEICPAWKQSNCNARANELNAIRHERAWTSEEQSEWSNMMSLWQAVKAIRSSSDEAESAINALTTLQEVENFSW